MKKIIDISHHQNPANINYDKIVANTAGVILRAAYGSRADNHFDTHYNAFKQRNHPIGCYHYITQYQSAQSQVDRLKAAIEGKSGFSMGFWADVEREAGATPLLRQQVIDYINAVEAQVWNVDGIYTSKTQWKAIMNGVYFNDKKLWVALYGENVYNWLPEGWNDYWLWQYSSTGRVDGYSGNLDMNQFRFGQAEFDAWVGGNTPPPDTESPLFRARVTATLGLRVRTGAGLNYPIAAPTMVYGTIVEVYETLNGWCRHSRGGWSDGTWLEQIEDNPEPPIIPDPIEPEPEEPVIPDGLLDVPHYSQTDPLWASDIIGASNFNIGAKGCLLTITAAGLTFFGFECNPMAYNCLASARGGYLITTENGKKYANMYWQFPDVLTKGQIVRDEYQTFASGTGWEQSANAILAKGKPVWCEVKLNGYQHWVLILGKVDGDYWILDPIDGQVKVMNYPLVFRTVSYSKK